MGSILDVIRTRRSTRNMTGQPIPEDTLKAILEAGRLAPSWKNGQCWRLIVVKDPARRALIARESSRGEVMTVAPVVIVGCALPEQSGHFNEQDYYLVDMGIVLEHIILEATAQGIATCWIGIFNESLIKESLGIPEDVRVVNMVIMGYPAEERNPRPRLSIEEIAFVDSWPAE